MISRVRIRLSRRYPYPRGVTLLEVMFSIGIIVVGLLGVMTILPVAGNRATQGTIADESDRVGRNAVRKFDLGRMRQPNTWTRLNTTSNPQNYVSFFPTVAEPAFCIDPLFLSTQLADAQLAGTTVATEAEFFPYFPVPYDATIPMPGEARMRRISLRNMPNGAAGMSLQQALRSFMSQDDLLLDLPTDRTLAPEQQFGDAGSPSQRQFEGKYTWLATVSPRELRYPSAAVDWQRLYPTAGLNWEPTLNWLPGSGPALCDHYTLSIIVLHRRDMSMTMHYPNPGLEGADPERLARVRFNDSAGNLVPGAGLGGGNLQFETVSRQITDSNGNVVNGHFKEDLNVRSGSWVMLSAKVQPTLTATAPQAAPQPASVFRWYRVLSIDAEPTGDSPFANPVVRSVSLLGPDWTDVIQAQLATNTTPWAQATMLNGVVAVYEKTIRLETSGMWTVY